MRRFASALALLTLLCAGPVFADEACSPCFQSSNQQQAIMMQQTLELNGIKSTVQSTHQGFAVEVSSDVADQAQTIVDYIQAASQPSPNIKYAESTCGQL